MLLAGDEDLQIVTASSERVDVPPEVRKHFETHDNLITNWNVAYQSSWAKVGPAGCDDQCIQVYPDSKSGVVINIKPASSTFTKLRLGLDVPSSCHNAMPFFEIKDDHDHVYVYHDPGEHPVFFRVHVYRFNNGKASVVFQNENTSKTRDVRLGMLCIE